MPLAFVLTLCFASGYLIVSLAWPSRSLHSDLLMRACLSVGCGLGAFSVIFFVTRALNSQHLVATDLSAVAILIVALLIRRARSVPAEITIDSREEFRLSPWLRRSLVISFVIAICAALYSTVLGTLVHPQGNGWDTFAIWNLHARFLFRGGTSWRDGFSALIPWSHPDYPPLLPSAIAHLWSYLGHDSPAVPALISVAFTFSTLGLLYSALARLRGRNAAMLGTLALASTPFFIEQGSAQYADVPLSLFFLVTIVLLCLQNEQYADSRGLLVLAGLSAGFAAWTKNEGLLFLLATLGVRGLSLILSKHRVDPARTQNLPESRRPLAAFALGAMPLLLLFAWFKHAIAPPGDLFSAPSAMFGKLMTPSRYWVILNWYGKEFFRFGEWWIVPGTVLLLILHVLTGGNRPWQNRPSHQAATWTLALTLAGYFAIYLITPNDLYWHLRFSLNRLFLQIWPSVIFLFCASISLRSSCDVSN